MARSLPTSNRRLRWLRWVRLSWAFVVAIGIVASLVAIAASDLPGGLWPPVLVVWMGSIPLVFRVTRRAVERELRSRALWWAALRVGSVPTGWTPIPPLASPPERVVGRAEAPSKVPYVAQALTALGGMAALLFGILMTGISGEPGEVGQMFSLTIIGVLAALIWGVWNAARALAPSAVQPVVLEADADELWIRLREGNGWMPTVRDAVQTRAWPWHAVRSARLRGPRDSPRLRYLGLYLTDPRGVEYTYDLTDVDVSIGDLEAMLTERAGVAVQVEVAPE